MQKKYSFKSVLKILRMYSNHRKTYNLSTILSRIEGIFEEKISRIPIWVKAEISKISFDKRSRHTYIDFIESKEGKTLAKCRATIWKSKLSSIQKSLGTSYKHILKDGTEIIFCGYLKFSKVYGLSINIIDIDVSYNIGEIERKKQFNIDFLDSNNLTNENKKVKTPVVIQHIAVIGSPKTSGHEDFLKQLNENEHGFSYFVDEYACRVQGDLAENEILSVLNIVESKRYDIIAIIRGGGSKFDLDVFNSLDIAKKVASLSIAVYTGIGHETDYSVLDHVANKYFKTPTALGAFIVERTYNYYLNITTNYIGILEKYNTILDNLKYKLSLTTNEIKHIAVSKTRLKRGDLHSTSNRLISHVKTILYEEKSFLKLNIEGLKLSPFSITYTREVIIKEISNYISLYTVQVNKKSYDNLKISEESVWSLIKLKLSSEKTFLSHIDSILEINNPDNILKRGFAIIRHNNKLLNSNSKIKKGDTLEIKLYNKSFSITVDKINNSWKTLLTNLLQKN